MSNNNHSRKLNDVCEIISTFFIRKFYNDIYNHAKKNNKLYKESKSITDEYIKGVHSFTSGIQTDIKMFKIVVGRLHEVYSTETKHTTITLNECIDHILIQFIPDEYFALLKNRDKDYYLQFIITESVIAFNSIAINQIKNIVDVRNQINIRSFINQYKDILYDVRNKIFDGIIKARTGKKVDQISKTTFDKLQSKFIETSEKLHNINNECIRAKQITEALYKENEKMNKKNEELILKNKDLIQKNKDLILNSAKYVLETKELLSDIKNVNIPKIDTLEDELPISDSDVTNNLESVHIESESESDSDDEEVVNRMDIINRRRMDIKSDNKVDNDDENQWLKLVDDE